MLLRLRQKETAKLAKTVEVYLPTKVTDPKNIYSYLAYFQALVKEMNMPYVNVTLDVGAAINAFKVIWKYSQQFSNVEIHLGGFNVLTEVMSEALERILLKRFLHEVGPNISDNLIDLASEEPEVQ